MSRGTGFFKLLFLTVPLLSGACIQNAPEMATKVRADESGRTTTAESVFSSYQRDCEADGGRLWGASLCGPLLLVREDGRVFANMLDPERRLHRLGDIWSADVPEQGPRPPYTDTSANWSGRDWAIIRYQPERSATEYARLALHESFHRIQPQLAFYQPDRTTADHLDEMNGRLWLRLSLRALAAALRAENIESAREHVVAALRMSIYRHRLIPGSESAERSLELHEGLAEYTGWRLARTASPELEFAAKLEEGDLTESFARSFPYLTGPAWGLAFDRLSLNWRPRLSAGGPSLVAIGRDALGVGDQVDSAAAVSIAGAYGYRELLADEQERAARLAVRRAEYRARFVDGPRLIVPLSSISFDPRTVTSLGEFGQVYGILNDVGPWGRLQTQHGALVSWSRREVVVDAEGEPRMPLWETPKWRLELNAGWRLERRGNALVVVQDQNSGQ